MKYVKRMQAVEGSSLAPAVEKRYRTVIERYYLHTPATAYIDGFAFDDRSAEALAVVITGKTVK